MQRKPFGPGPELPVIGQGTWDLPESGARRRDAVESLRRGIALGMTHIDTAEMYGAGRVEQIVGEAIAQVPRSELFITSKVLPSNASYAGTIAACERSLRYLRTGYLDCYLLHWPGSHPLEETMRALEDLVASGKTRWIGVSNFDTEGMLEAQSYLRSVPLACNQVLYHLRERGIEHDLIPAAAQRKIAIVGYTPFGRARIDHPVLAQIAAQHGVTQRQVVLAFLTREPNVFTIPKASTIAHVEENAAAGDLELDAGEIEAIERAFPRGPRRPLETL
jgi:diketogulonate reductase-like aldo/keto reductase